MKVDVLLGLQWGDEGKGKVVDVLTPRYDVIARFQGGPNAGHSLEFNEIKHVLHTIPSGIFRGDQMNIIGNGVVIDPIIFKKEVEGIARLNVDLSKNLFISKKAHLILPSHRILDEASEKSKGKTKIGSTLKGIGPTYMDKTGRNGLRVGDILNADFKEKYNALIEKHKTLLRQYDFEFTIADFEKGWFEGIEELKKYQIIDSEYYINELIDTDHTILAEGAQGTMLDIDFGSYPYVTSSNTISAGACTGLGVAPNKIGEVIGIFKAYCTRVGSGPFPTELHDDTGELLRKMGNEYGATTGRPRRCGWLDLPALRYAVMINGVTQMVMTKADVLNDFDSIKVCTKYHTPDGDKEILPYCLEKDIEPVYTSLPGWNKNISTARTKDELPEELNAYIKYIELKVGVPIKILSVGPNRDETILR